MNNRFYDNIDGSIYNTLHYANLSRILLIFNFYVTIKLRIGATYLQYILHINGRITFV